VCFRDVSSQLPLCTSRMMICAVGRYIGYYRLRNQSASSRNAGHLVLACRSCMKWSALVEGRLCAVPSTAFSCQIHAYTLSWQSLLGPDTAMGFLDVELFHTPDQAENLRQAWHNMCPGLHHVGTQPGGSKQCWRPVIMLLQARRSHPTDQSNTQIHSLSRLAGGDFRSSGR
jgi:hypothetical protein